MQILVQGLESDVSNMRLAKAGRVHQLHISDSCEDVSVEDCSQCHEQHFPTLHAKSSSYNNILEAVGDFSAISSDDKTESSAQINRARSSSDIAALAPPKHLSTIKSTSFVKLKGGKWKEKYSKTQKFGPKLSKYGSKTSKSGHTLSPADPQDQIKRLRAEALVPLSDDLLIFSKMHEEFRKQIANFIST